MVGQPSFFHLDERYAALSVAGDPLERLATVIDFELFRSGSGGNAVDPPLLGDSTNDNSTKDGMPIRVTPG